MRKKYKYIVSKVDEKIEKAKETNEKVVSIWRFEDSKVLKFLTKYYKKRGYEVSDVWDWNEWDDKNEVVKINLSI